MNEWIVNLKDMVRFVLANPSSPLEMWVLLGLSFLMMWAIVSKAGSLLGIINTRPAQTLIVTVVGIVLSLAALVAAQMYLPAWGNPDYRLWILIGIPVVVTFVLVAPFMGLFQKARYGAAVITWVLAVAGAACVILLVGALFDSFASGSQEAEKGKAHKEEIEQIQQ
jgi:hypothetical protein